MSSSVSLKSLLPAVAAVFLQACSQQPETVIVDNTQKTHFLAAQKAETLNKSAERVLANMKQDSLDGKGRVFFKDGIGIVYPNALALARSIVSQESFCTEYHPETLMREKKCAIREVESLATMPVIYSPTAPLYINGTKSVICPGKPSALFSLTDAFDLNRDKSPCKDISLSSLPTPALYRYVTEGLKASKGKMIEKPALEWANIMPTTL